MVRSKKGYSLTELVIVVAIMGVMAAMAIPRFSTSLVGKTKAEAAAYKLIADLRLARSMAIRDAATNDKGYEVDLTSTTYTIENTKTHATVASHTFTSGVTVAWTGSSKFVFEPLGDLKSGSGTQITLAAGGRTCTLTFVAATGEIKCTKS
jgi:prepilin-type N-terminal cleavage/methylation domain-containing protein